METQALERVWSRSQMAAFRECVRKGIFSSSKNTALPADLERLKKMKNRFMWIGAALHDELGRIIKEVRQGNPPPDPDEEIQSFRTKLREEYRNSQQGVLGENALFEHVYKRKISPDVWQGHWRQVETSIRWFLNSTWLKRLQTVGPDAWKAVDEVLSFHVGDVRVYTKIDCALVIDDRTILIDWKTSALRPDGGEPLELAALYAMDVWGSDPEKLSAHEVSVLTGASRAHSFSEETLLERSLRVNEEAAFLEDLKNQHQGDWSRVPGPAVMETCDRCQFQKICHPAGVHAA